MDNTNDQAELITLSEARQMLGVSRIKMAQLVRDGYLQATPSVLDKRAKLVRRHEVLELQRRDRAA